MMISWVYGDSIVAHYNSQRLQHLFDERWDQQRTLVLLVDDHGGDDVVAVQERHIVEMITMMMMTMAMRMIWMTFPNSSSHGE